MRRFACAGKVRSSLGPSAPRPEVSAIPSCVPQPVRSLWTACLGRTGTVQEPGRPPRPEVSARPRLPSCILDPARFLAPLCTSRPDPRRFAARLVPLRRGLPVVAGNFLRLGRAESDSDWDDTAGSSIGAESLDCLQPEVAGRQADCLQADCLQASEADRQTACLQTACLQTSCLQEPETSDRPRALCAGPRRWAFGLAVFGLAVLRSGPCHGGSGTVTAALSR